MSHTNAPDLSITEIEDLARASYELVLDLIPDAGDAMPTPTDARLSGIQLLQNLKCIRLEAELLRMKAGNARPEATQ